MTRIVSLGAGVLTVTLLLAGSAAHLSAQTTTANKRTFLTFSRPVQVPGATLPAGTYVFRIADPDAQQVWQVLDAKERHVLAQFFYVRARERTIPEANAAHGKPVVRFYETAQGVPPAIRVFYYPSDLSGAEFLYPKDQAIQLAAISKQPVLATDSNARKSTLAHIMTIEPEASQAANVATSAETAAPNAPATAPHKPSDESRPVGTSGTDEPRPLGTTGEDKAPASSPRPIDTPAVRELPKTASPLPLIGWLGALAFTSGLAIRLRGGRSPF